MIKRLTLCILFVVLIHAVAFVEEIICSTSSPKFECFDKDGLAIIQQMVDEGHQPWRVDPVYYAKHFMNSYYPDLNSNDREKLPAELIIKNKKTSMRIVFDCKEFASYPIINTKWDTWTDEFKRKYSHVVVKISYSGKEHAIYLHKAFPANVESIWIVEKMVIK